MARLAGHGSSAVKMAFIDGQDHFDHAARGLLLRLVIFIVGALHMAEGALHAEGGSNQAHRYRNLFRRNALEDLNVLVLLLRFPDGRRSLTRLRRSMLQAQRRREQASKKRARYETRTSWQCHAASLMVSEYYVEPLQRIRRVGFDSKNLVVPGKKLLLRF
jgi:hypothetical protein